LQKQLYLAGKLTTLNSSVPFSITGNISYVPYSMLVSRYEQYPSINLYMTFYVLS